MIPNTWKVSKLRKTLAAIGQLRNTSGLNGHFSKLIVNFRKKASFLFELLTGYENQTGWREAIDWDTRQREALESLLTELVAPPLLAYSNFDLQYILHKDPSSRLKRTLCQIQKDQLKVIGQGSPAIGYWNSWV